MPQAASQPMSKGLRRFPAVMISAPAGMSCPMARMFCPGSAAFVSFTLACRNGA
jgi:hypothetical protein